MAKNSFVAEVTFKQTISLQIFQKLPSTNFTWSTLEYFVPYRDHIYVLSSLTRGFDRKKNDSKFSSIYISFLRAKIRFGAKCFQHIKDKMYLLVNGIFPWQSKMNFDV